MRSTGAGGGAWLQPRRRERERRPRWPAAEGCSASRPSRRRSRPRQGLAARGRLGGRPRRLSAGARRRSKPPTSPGLELYEDFPCPQPKRGRWLARACGLRFGWSSSAIARASSSRARGRAPASAACGCAHRGSLRRARAPADWRPRARRAPAGGRRGRPPPAGRAPSAPTARRAAGSARPSRPSSAAGGGASSSRRDGWSQAPPAPRR